VFGAVPCGARPQEAIMSASATGATKKYRIIGEHIARRIV
jgi:hypothetical protein